MKTFLIFACGVFLLTSEFAKAQVKCPIPCSEEEFPYIFCPNIVQCSSDPNNEGGTVYKAYLPNCVHVDQTSTSGDLTGMPTVGKSQALGVVPGPEPADTCGTEPDPNPLPPDRQTIFDRYVNDGFHNDGFFVPPYFRSYTYHPEDWNSEEEYDSAIAQWNLDSSNFLNGFDPEHIDNTGDQSVDTGAHWYYNTDYGWLNEEYDNEYAQYQADLQAYSDWVTCDSTFSAKDSLWQAVCKQVQYVTVWDDSSAQNDANIALNEWYAACPGIQQNDCCVRVNFDQNADHFRQADYSLGSGSPIDLALTPDTLCGISGCPDSNKLFINFNVSTKFLFASNSDDPQPDPNYPASVASRTFFTGPNVPNVNPDFELYSFRYTMEHELGHWFGFVHTDILACYNNVDSCAGYSSVMNPYASNRTAPMPVTCEDLNMFRKLYCPNTPCQSCVAGVEESEAVEKLKAAIFPNPTTGACLLQYYMTDRSLVQIEIYDVLGNQVRMVSSGYEEQGEQSISLGTETLPSGHYICRIRVGDSVANLNVVVER